MAKLNLCIVHYAICKCVGKRLKGEMGEGSVVEGCG